MHKSTLHSLVHFFGCNVLTSVLCTKKLVRPLSGGFFGLIVFILGTSAVSNANPSPAFGGLQGQCPPGLSPDQGCLLKEDGTIIGVSKDPKDDELNAPVDPYGGK
jgi:hypothetical protein